MALHTDFDTLIVADVCDSAHGRLCVITAELGDLCGKVLGLTDGLQVGRVGVLVHGTEETTGRCSDGELCEGEQGRGENGLGEHVGGACDSFEVWKRWYDRL